MSLQVDWTRPALEDVNRLDRLTKERIFHAVDRYATTGHGDVRKMQEREDGFRLRVGKWRVLFRLLEDEQIIRVRRVLPRGSEYKP